MDTSSGRGFGRVTWGLGLVLGIVASAHAQTTSDANKVDVLGLHLGMSQSDVSAWVAGKMPAAATTLSQGSFSLGDFTSPNFTWGEKIDEDQDADITPGKEQLSIIYSFEPPNQVIQVNRHIFFDLNTAPTVSDLESSLIAKYGKPDAIELGSVPNTKLFWTYGSAYHYHTHSLDEGFYCYVSADGGGGGFSDQMMNGNLQSPPRNSLAKCGAWLTVEIDPLQANHKLVGNFWLSVSNLSGLFDSYNYINSYLQKGAADKSASEASKAAGNKPQL